ncbi:MAG TPA: hypothetical protein GX715_00385 [Armatimonadetes bacterium]|nr:hypothetical protein [Armatimonadota bacterium]
MRSDYYDELIRRNDIVAVAQELGLAVRGTRCRCLRPEAHAHGDRSPSLSFNRRRNTFHCWVCPDVGGSVIDLVMLARGVSREGAVAYLAARAGMPPPPAGSRGASTVPRRFPTPAPKSRTAPEATPGTRGPRVRLVQEDPDAYALVAPDRPPPAPEPQLEPEQIARIYSRFLFWCDRIGEVNYLTRWRGISRETADRMGIVWVHDATSIENRLRDDYAEEELRASGLFNERGLIFYRHPIVFPFYHQGKACFLQGRRVDGREPKYLSVRRPICCLYNHDILATLSPGDAVVLSEGVIDTLTWLEYGVPAVGILGVGCFKSEWIPKFRDRRVLICLDNDEPGQRAARDLRQRFIAAGQQAFLVTLPEGVKDINELFLKYPRLDGITLIQ